MNKLTEDAHYYRYHLRQAKALQAVLDDKSSKLTFDQRYEIAQSQRYFEEQAKALQAAYREFSETREA